MKKAVGSQPASIPEVVVELCVAMFRSFVFESDDPNLKYLGLLKREKEKYMTINLLLDRIRECSAMILLLLTITMLLAAQMIQKTSMDSNE